MGKTFTVDDQALDNASTELDTISGNYTRISNQLMEKAQTMGAAWDSADNLAFVEQISGFCDDMQAMATKLKSASQTIAQQSKNYKTHREDNIAQVKKLQN